MIRCEWASVAPNSLTAARFPNAYAFHVAHGPNLTRCDAWVCVCGNRPDLEGFDATPGLGGAVDVHAGYRCARCARCYTTAGVEVVES